MSSREATATWKRCCSIPFAAAEYLTMWREKTRNRSTLTTARDAGEQFVVRTATAPVAQLAAVRPVLRNVAPASGLKVETMFAAIGFAFLPSQVGAILMGSVGTLGLLVAIVGLYRVLAYSVARRTREIGIRLAIGATPGHVSKIVLSEFARLLALGIGIGLAAALLATRPLAIFLVPGLSAS